MTIKRVLIYVASAVVGALLAAGIFSLLPSAAPSVAVALGIAETYKVPTAQELIDKYGSQVKKSDNSIALGPDGSITVPVQGGTSGSGSGGPGPGAGGGGTSGGSGTSAGGGGITSGNTTATCPGAAACTTGYVAPNIRWDGVIACSPIDKSQGTWAFTVKWSAVGGNWKGVWNGVNQDGTVSGTFQTSPGEAGGQPIGMGQYVSIMITDMLGQGTKIDEVFSSSSPGVPMNSVCH